MASQKKSLKLRLGYHIEPKDHKENILKKNSSDHFGGCAFPPNILLFFEFFEFFEVQLPF
jgi:hypothetical protein